MNMVENLLAHAVNLWHSYQPSFNFFLQNVDPGLFQNVILGALALLVPIGVGILSFFFEERSKGQIESNLELYILLKQVLKAKWIVIFSLLGLFLFSLYNQSLYNQIIAIVFFVFYITWLFLIPLKNIWKWFFEDTVNFSLDFLKNFNVLKNTQTLTTSWQALWLSENKRINEREYTKVFIEHIDKAIKNKKYSIAILLAQIYEKGIERRDPFSVGYEILPKIFEWNEVLWEEEQQWLEKERIKDKVQNNKLISRFPIIKKRIFNFLSREYQREDFFWHWHYFQQTFFPATVKKLLQDGHGPYQLFSQFKKHVAESEKKLNNIQDEQQKQKQWDYIRGLFAGFSPVFFESINTANDSFEIWEHFFPREWKVTSSNKESNPSRIILHEFIEWARKRLFGSIKKETDDPDLTEVVNGLFPNVHNELFPAFISLLFTGDIKYAIKHEPRFFLVNSSISWSGEKNEEEIQQMFTKQDQGQQEETVEIIFNFFQEWRLLKPFRDEISEEELTNWDKYTKEQHKEIINRVRKLKFEKVLEELNSKEVLELCRESELYEHRRQSLIKLISLMIKKINAE